jgi:transposase
MSGISGFERSQLLLLPEAVDDYVGADNPVRFIDAFVGELDRSAAVFRPVAAKATGRSGYALGDLLKLYIYGYLNRVRPSQHNARWRYLSRQASGKTAIIVIEAPHLAA